MNTKLKSNFHKTLILRIACLLAFNACSTIKGTVDSRQGRTILLTIVEQGHENLGTRAVHPGEPYNQGLWPDSMDGGTRWNAGFQREKLEIHNS